MPIYEYQCQSCGVRSEVLQKMSDPPLTVCTACGGELRKLISSPAFQFKGSGWYVTDYAKGSGKGGGSSAKEGAGASEGAKGAGASGGSESGASEGKSAASEAKPASSSAAEPAPKSTSKA